MDIKQVVGLEAAGLVRSGMVVGLGTGSTAAFFVLELARRIREEKLDFRGVPSSHACEILATDAGIPLLQPSQVSRIDLYVDGADEVAPDKGLIKGRGAAMVGEKLLAEACDRFVVIVDEGKLVERLGAKFPVPVEVLPAAWRIVQRKLESLGGTASLRMGLRKDGPVVTDNGNLILDTVFIPAGALDWDALESALDALPGIVDHGLFLRYRDRSQVMVGTASGVKLIS